MSVSKVKIASDAYIVCLHHALTTECEEIMGLLIGQFTQVNKYSLNKHWLRLDISYEI